MKDWPSDESRGVSLEDLIHPLRRIVYEGYELKRKPLLQFAYAGYNIGKTDRLYHPTPDERFSSRWLENDAKFNRTLFDNVLITAVQLGMEQARRLEKDEKYTNSLLEDIVKVQAKKIKDLKAHLAHYDANYAEDNIPMEHEGEDLIIDDTGILPDNVDA